MFISTSLQEQVAQLRDDGVRVLIAGAGVAGLTLAQRLRAEGLHPVLIERAPDHAETGYMLALMPLVDLVLQETGVQEAYRERSVPFNRYVLHGHRGQLLRDYDIGGLLGPYGDYRGLARGELMSALAAEGAPVSYEATLTLLQQSSDVVRVTLTQAEDECEAEFDVVVIAEGMHSESRHLLLAADEVAAFDTHWGCWVAWMPMDAEHADRGDEVWGADFFIGIYPVKGLAGVVVAGHEDDVRADPKRFLAQIREQLSAHNAWVDAALDAVESQPKPFYWKFADCRSARWVTGRAVLLGDAAAGFLPTAGVGAGMAMESAGVLARRLLAASRDTVPAALQDYERAQRPRVEAAQDNSRQLARLMFWRSRTLAIVRDVIAHFVSLKAALRPIQQLLDNPPDAT